MRELLSKFILSSFLLLNVLVLLSCVSSEARQDSNIIKTSPNTQTASWVSQFSHIDPDKVLKKKQREKLLKYFHQNHQKIANKNYLSLFDLSQNSSKQRYHLIDLKSGKVTSYLSAHGKGSDPDHDGIATIFSNKSGSHMTSLGFYLTAEKYIGSNGLSLRLDGLEKSNSNARPRAIVIHGADYVDPKRKKIGRSFGCPAFERKYAKSIIDKIAQGSLLLITK